MNTNWYDFPYDNSEILYQGDELSEHWDRLHRGDCEPMPESEDLAEAWRAYHRGDFQDAYQAGLELGDDGYYVAAKAAGIHATYLIEDEDEQLEAFEAIAKMSEKAQKATPKKHNAYYFHAFALGRYSQGISIVKALAEGMGGKIKASLDQTLKLAPDHADAHTALGLYHAEILDKVGKMVGKLTYGASKDKALEHFENAARIFPESAIAKVEFANGILLMEGDRGYDKASELYVAASESEPWDAMEMLDVALAQSELE